MAISYEVIKEQVLITLYDYMLTSEEEYCWFSRQQIRAALSPEVSGAFLKRAIDSLTEDKQIQEGVGDPEGEPEDTPVFSLTDYGIRSAESGLIKMGWTLSDYHPAPSVDRIISQASEPELHAQIRSQLEQVSEELRTSNEAAEQCGEAKDLIAGELEAAKTLSSKESFRAQRMIALIIPALRYLADKCLGSALGEAAKRLIELIMKIS